jgi:hypothetical protein
MMVATLVNMFGSYRWLFPTLYKKLYPVFVSLRISLAILQAARLVRTRGYVDFLNLTAEVFKHSFSKDTKE